MSASLCFIDTETTSLRPDRRAWEIGLIVRKPDGGQSEHHWFIDSADLDLGNADLMSLKIGRYHERHPLVAGSLHAMSERDALISVEMLTRGAHLVGAVVSFDAEVLAARMRAHGICPSWHYHLIDVEALAVGALSHSAAYGRSSAGSKRELTGSITALPWKSEALSRALGVDPDDFERHTALGDAGWAMAIYDAVVGGAA